MKNNINNDILLANGYRQYEDHFYNAKNLWQKKVKDNKGIKYFIDIYEYNASYEVILTTNTNNYTASLVLFGFNKDINLIDIEKDIERFWITLGGNYYE